MKRMILAALAATLSVWASAQNVSYSLPRTTVAVEVDAVQEYCFAGPYAAYAKRLLGLDVPQQDAVTTRITEIRLQPLLETDPDTVYTVPAKYKDYLPLSAQGLVSFAAKEEAEDYLWRFRTPVKADYAGKVVIAGEKDESYYVYQSVKRHVTDSLATTMRVEQKRKVGKTVEEMAKEAADLILLARQERLNIAIGNTDASFSGEALGAALDELTRIEQEYLPLFTGVSQRVRLHGNFEVTPGASARTQRYLAFVLSDEEGLVQAGDGTPYYLQVVPATVPSEEAAKVSRFDARKPRLHYREPAVCTVRLLENTQPILETRMPLYQMGAQRTILLK